MSKGNILIVEDEAAIAQDLQDIIEMEGYDVIGVAYTHAQAIEILAASKPDLAFLDISLRGPGTGLDIAKLLNDKYKVPFIFLTSFSDQETIKEVVELNPSGYLVKPFKERDIAPALAVAMAKKSVISSAFPTVNDINKALLTEISSQEYKVLRLIWQGKKNAEIADALFVSINTIKTHIAKIYSKLGVSSRASAIHKVVNL